MWNIKKKGGAVFRDFNFKNFVAISGRPSIPSVTCGVGGRGGGKGRYGVMGRGSAGGGLEASDASERGWGWGKLR